MNFALVPFPEFRAVHDLPASIKLTGEYLRIGRARDNEIHISVPSVSRHHARLAITSHGWLITNLSEPNPVCVNGKSCQEALLAHRDTIQIGEVLFEIRDLDRSTGSTSRFELAAGGAMRAVPSRILDSGLPQKELCDGILSLLEETPQLSTEAEVFRSVERTLGSVVQSDLLMVAHAGPDGLPRVDTGQHASEYSSTLLHACWRENREVLWRAERDPAASHSIGAFRIHSIICCPITSGGASDSHDGTGEGTVGTASRAQAPPAGLVYLHRLDPPGFSDDDVQVVRIIARVAATMLALLGSQRRLTWEVASLRSRVHEGIQVKIAGPTTRRIFEEATQVAQSGENVLLRGATGTGKEVLARTIHQASPRKNGPFIAVNCASIPDTLLESELFGYGRNPGIVNADPAGRKGKVLSADGGTMFLDEIGDLPYSAQSTLLRVLETGSFDPVGSDTPVNVNFRLISATHQDLEEMIEKGEFRRDLYHRINTFTIQIPPLASRPDEIGPLAIHFAEQVLERADPGVLPDPLIAPDAIAQLEAHSWPGNVRELLNTMIRAVHRAGGRTIRAAHLGLTEGEGEAESAVVDQALRPPLRTLAEVEEDHIRRVLDACGGKIGQAAEVLGIHRNTLRNRLGRLPEDPGG